MPELSIAEVIAILRDLKDFNALLAKLRVDMARHMVLSDPWVALAQRESTCLARIRHLTEQLAWSLP